MIWSGLGWDPKADVGELLRQYSRAFVGDVDADGFAEGLLALEKNWQGPLLTNDSVERTLAHFQDLLGGAGPEARDNWRFQQAMYRACYDAYVRKRLLRETRIENEAYQASARPGRRGPLAAIRAAARTFSTGPPRPRPPATEPADSRAGRGPLRRASGCN